MIFEFSDGLPTLIDFSEKDITLVDSTFDFTEKWSLAESLLKCDGGGFGVAADVSKIQKSCYSSTVRLMTENKTFALSISIKKPIM